MIRSVRAQLAGCWRARERDDDSIERDDTRRLQEIGGRKGRREGWRDALPVAGVDEIPRDRPARIVTTSRNSNTTPILHIARIVCVLVPLVERYYRLCGDGIVSVTHYRGYFMSHLNS